MPRAERSDGTSLDWEAVGAGPAVLITTQVFADREVSSGLIDELSTDHRVVTYDPRGTGESSPEGPYDNRTDAADLRAILESAVDAADGPAVIIGLGNAAEVAVLAAASAPREMVGGVVVPFGNPAGVRAARQSEALVGSSSVLEAMDDMLANDYRAGLRSVIAIGNPRMGEDEVRERVDRQVAYCPPEVAIARVASWRRDGVIGEARELGARLWILQHPHNPWFPADMLEPTRELLPDANIEEVEDGHLSRPDLTAGVIRGITGGN
jgi:pimeloyl-ACP methyl ester carboxylesterase